jgi:UDP-N-acetylmuramoyl-L-alanyl-D-glutamate--2,6-diaminopimelate ligase
MVIVQKLAKLLEGIDFIGISGDPAVEIVNLEYDSRKVIPGSLFFALPGTLTDGHDFIDKAISSGARSVVCENLPANRDENVVYIRVKDSSYTLGLIASAFYGFPSRRLKLTGITGTNGKTTTATLLYQLFRQLGFRTGLISTIRYFIDERSLPATHTTPDPIKLNYLLAEMADEGCDYCFMEVSSHSIVQQRIAGLHFTGGIFTNISHDHLDYHVTFSEYLKAKKKFFDILGKDSFALVNKDDRNSGFMTQNTNAGVGSYALKSMADFMGNIVESRQDGMLLVFDGTELWTGLIGDFNAYNLLAVYACGIMLGADKDEVLRILSSLTPVEGRFETIRSQGGITAIVDYAHTPDALDNVTETVRRMLLPGQKLITVTGAGGDRDREKRPVMARIAAEKSHSVIITSDNPRSEEPDKIINDMLEGVEKSLRNRVLCITSRAEAIRTACMLARPGDFVLVAGKGHETYQEVKGVKHHFDDREVIRSVFDAMNLQ